MKGICSKQIKFAHPKKINKKYPNYFIPLLFTDIKSFIYCIPVKMFLIVRMILNL